MNAYHDDSTPAGWAAHVLTAWRELRAERERRTEAERDRDAYRALTQQALHTLAELTQKHRRQTARLTALLNARQDERKAA